MAVATERCREDEAKKTVRLAAASGSPMHVEGDAKLEFDRTGKKCSMKFLDADVQRRLASVSATVCECSTVVFGPQDSHIENTSTGQRLPMTRRNGVVVMQLKAQAGADETKDGEVGRTDHKFGFWEAGVSRNPEETCERCKIKTGSKAGTAGHVTRIGGVDDAVREESEEIKDMTKKRTSGTGRPCGSTIFVNRANRKESKMKMTQIPFRSWWRHSIKRRGREQRK